MHVIQWHWSASFCCESRIISLTFSCPGIKNITFQCLFPISGFGLWGLHDKTQKKFSLNPAAQRVVILGIQLYFLECPFFGHFLRLWIKSCFTKRSMTELRRMWTSCFNFIRQNERTKFIFHWVTLEDPLYWLLYWAIHLMEILE